jgi:DNA-binding NarL/FixJ family response regulator
METIRILIAEQKDDHLKELANLIKREQDIELLDTVEKSNQVIKQMALNPDIILLNSALFPPEELSMIFHKIKKKSPKTGILFLLRKDADDKALMEALIEGVKGYVKRTEISRYLIEAIRAVAAGEIWAERRILNKFITGTPLIQKNIESKLKALSNPLTRRETAIIHEVLKGASNRDISRKYKITEMTVKTHLYRIYKKMKVKSRAQAIAYLIYS